MKKNILLKSILLLTFFCLLLPNTKSITIPSLLPLPTSTNFTLQLTLSLQKLVNVLQYFGTRQQDNVAIYKRVILTQNYLIQLSNYLIQYNNVIIGGNNTINGSKNIVVGNYDNVTGSNNWVFVSSYTGNITSSLVIQNWVIHLDKAKLILINPQFAISFIDAPENIDLKNRYLNKNRQFAQKHLQTTNLPVMGQFSQQMNTNSPFIQSAAQYDPTKPSPIPVYNQQRIQQNAYQPQVQSQQTFNSQLPVQNQLSFNNQPLIQSQPYQNTPQIQSYQPFAQTQQQGPSGLLSWTNNLWMAP